MKIIHFDRSLGEMKIQLDTLDDMWHLEKIISKGDIIEAKTMRTYKIGTKEEKKLVTLRIKAEKVDFSKSFNSLRILGVIEWGTPEEFVQIGRHHTIEAGPKDRIMVIKNWKTHEIKRIEDAQSESKKPKIRIIVLDEEKALTAILRSFGVDYGPEFYCSGSKRDEKYEEIKLSYFGKIMAEIEKFDEKYIVAGPGFAKDNLKEFIRKRKPELLNKITFDSVSYAERSGVNELFKRGTIDAILGEERLKKEMDLMETVLLNIYKENGKAVYGINEVKAAAESFAIEKLLILDEYLRKDKNAEETVDIADKNRAEIIVISSEGDAGEKLRGFGMIAALLRFKL